MITLVSRITFFAKEVALVIDSVLNRFCDIVLNWFTDLVTSFSETIVVYHYVGH